MGPLGLKVMVMALMLTLLRPRARRPHLALATSAYAPAGGAANTPKRTVCPPALLAEPQCVAAPRDRVMHWREARDGRTV